MNTMESKHKAITLVMSISLGILSTAGCFVWDSYMEKAKQESKDATQQALFATFEAVHKNSSVPDTASLSSIVGIGTKRSGVVSLQEALHNYFNQRQWEGWTHERPTK